ncbi:MAG TPA: UvrD-helicase domain-containing protein [Pyrinomonadaceae bacterium]|nr:UvrD-helicase domain-containing protein [Pyrinomonadaceae bacterium]
MKPLPETNVAHYRVMEPLGAGGMGAVYKAYDEKLHRVVALKLLPPEYTTHEDRRRRFLQEARAASALNHPHILTVYEFGEDGGRPYMATEYVEGETLRMKIAARSLRVVEALDIAVQIAEGLAKAHEAGIVHRDLKPENLIVSRDGYAKILDFGIAKLVPRRGHAAAPAADSAQETLIRVETQPGAILGTVNYMAPEQLLGRRVDVRCDVFAFGVVLCEMLTGSCPFACDNQIDTMHAILHEEPRLRDALRSLLPPGAERILSKALDKEPKRRYQTVRELAAELKAFKRDLELGQVVPTQTRTKLVLRRVTTLPRASGIDYEKELNEAQFEAVTTTEGPLLVVAGAGTGKTRTLVYRVARLVESGVRPESVLLLTFTRRAAAGMLARAAGLADSRCQRVSGGTFHSLGHSVLRKHAEAAGVSRNFTVLDSSDTEDLIELLRRQMHLTRERHFPRKRTICSIFSMMVNKVSTLEEVLRSCYPHFLDEQRALEELYGTFEEFKRARHLLTYDDLLVRLREALEGSPELCRLLSEQYRYVMVDEYQDTNKLQARIVRLLAAAHDNVAVVGDECQSIYSFRGASHRNMLEFPDLFPSSRVIKLEENYRSTQPILDLANAIISEAKEGYGKHLFSRVDDDAEPPLAVTARDENEQSRFVAERIAELRDQGVPLSEVAVLFRAGSHSFDLEIELAKHGLQFRKYGGIKFAESAHVKDALAFLRVVANPSDTLSWLRALKLIDHVGDATANQILDHLGVERKEFRAARAKDGLFKKLHRFPSRPGYKEQLTRLTRLLGGLVGVKTPGAQLSAVLRFYKPILKARYDDHPRRARDLEHLQTIAKRYKTAAELLADVALDPSDATRAEGRERGGGYVTLSTVHSAKGLEWDALFIIWMTDGWFPSARSQDELEDLEEERRLLYVATTRARRHLYLVSPLNPYRGADGDELPSVSRFLESIPDDILPRASLS